MSRSAIMVWIIVIFFGASLLTMLYFTVLLKLSAIEIYFLQFKIEKHPMLIVMVDDVLEKIRKQYDIPVLYKTYEEMNKGVTDENKKALGYYIHINSPAHVKNCRKVLQDIDVMEKEWHRPFREICKIVGSTCSGDKEDFMIPRIELCTDEIKMYGLDYHYSTYFHELGHHIASIRYGDHTEEAANAIGSQLVFDNLPYYFQLFPILSFRYTAKKPEMPTKDKLRAYYEFWQYLRVKNKK